MSKVLCYMLICICFLCMFILYICLLIRVNERNKYIKKYIDLDGYIFKLFKILDDNFEIYLSTTNVASYLVINDIRIMLVDIKLYNFLTSYFNILEYDFAVVKESFEDC